VKRKIRENPDLEHWPAFSKSYNKMLDLLEDLCSSSGKRLVVIISGDVHFSYNMSGLLLRSPGRRFYQLVSSPARNRLTNKQAALILSLSTPVAAAAIQLGRVLAFASGFGSFIPPSLDSVAQRTRLKWDPIQTGRGWIWIGNFIAQLRLTAGVMQVEYERAEHVSGLTESESDPYTSRRLVTTASFTRVIT
jgi:hypothetical protein